MGTKVTILRQPVKLGVKDGRIFLEVHKGEAVDYYHEALNLIMARKLLPRVDRVKLWRVLKEQTGVPEDITR
jgi:L,D-transpeptidase ErfK/SrfK